MQWNRSLILPFVFCCLDGQSNPKLRSDMQRGSVHENSTSVVKRKGRSKEPGDRERENGERKGCGDGNVLQKWEREKEWKDGRRRFFFKLETVQIWPVTVRRAGAKAEKNGEGTTVSAWS